MPVIAVFLLEILKKYWKYILLAIILLSFFTYMSIIFRHAREYKVEKKEIQTQQKTIVNFNDALAKQKQYTVDVENNNNQLISTSNAINSESKKQTTVFHNHIDNTRDVSSDFNEMFERFNNE